MGIYYMDTSHTCDRYSKPKSCRECHNSYYEYLCPDACYDNYEKCPIRTINTPHGALVDANEVEAKMIKHGFKSSTMTVTEFINDVLTVVLEAEVCE